MCIICSNVAQNNKFHTLNSKQPTGVMIVKERTKTEKRRWLRRLDFQETFRIKSEPHFPDCWSDLPTCHQNQHKNPPSGESSSACAFRSVRGLTFLLMLTRSRTANGREDHATVDNTYLYTRTYVCMLGLTIIVTHKNPWK